MTPPFFSSFFTRNTATPRLNVSYTIISAKPFPARYLGRAAGPSRQDPVHRQPPVAVGQTLRVRGRADAERVTPRRTKLLPFVPADIEEGRRPRAALSTSRKVSSSAMVEPPTYRLRAARSGRRADRHPRRAAVFFRQHQFCRADDLRRGSFARADSRSAQAALHRGAAG